MEGDNKIPPSESAASKTKSPARGTKQGPWIFLLELPTLAFLLLTCSSRLPHCSSICSCTSWGGSLLLPQSTASAAHTGHWTRKRCFEASSEAMGMHYRERHVRRGIKKKIWAMLSLLYPQSLKQFVSTWAGPGCIFQPLRHLGTWTLSAHTLPQGPLWTLIWELLV